MIKNKVLVVISIVLCVIFLLLHLTGCTSSNRLEYISKTLDTNLENCKIEKEKDTHRGFLGDGDYFAKIICTDKEDSEITSNWKELPLSEELQKVMDMIQYDNKGGNDVYDKYNIPKGIENGYYYFFDRHSDSTDNKSDEELNERSSYNFSLGIYDSDTKILYYYELDT